MPVAAAHKTLVHLADGRELIYFDAEAGAGRAAYPDTRPLDPRPGSGESRFDPLLGEWVAIAANRQVRPYHPGPDVCPLCPSTATRLTEIPAPDYEVAVFENRFPSLSGPPKPPDELIGPLPHRLRRGGGRCEVVAFTSDRGPVRYYTWDRASRKGTKLFSHQPKLEGLTLAPMEPVVIRSRDGLALNSYLTLPPGVAPNGETVSTPYYLVHYDFVLQKAAAKAAAA